MDTTQWPQEIMEDKVSHTTSSSLANTSSNNNNNNNNNNKVGSTCLERKIRPKEADEATKCPRCNSSNTKFCYYNNYSLTQPRYFCKACKRYWTAGGCLRNIPVGGGSRKNKRSSSSSSFGSCSPPPCSKRISSHDLVASQHMNSSNPNNKIHYSQDRLNLGFPISQQFTTLSEFIHLPTSAKGEQSTTNYHHLSALELLNGVSLTPFIPDPNNNNEGEYSSGYPSLQEYSRPSLNFSLEQGHVENNVGRLLFPFEDLKQVSSSSTIIDGGTHHNNTITTTTTTNINNSKTNEEEEIRDDNDDNNGESTNGYWSGMLDAGGSW